MDPIDDGPMLKCLSPSKYEWEHTFVCVWIKNEYGRTMTNEDAGLIINQIESDLFRNTCSTSNWFKYNGFIFGKHMICSYDVRAVIVMENMQQ